MVLNRYADTENQRYTLFVRRIEALPLPNEDTVDGYEEFRMAMQRAELGWVNVIRDLRHEITYAVSEESDCPIHYPILTPSQARQILSPEKGSSPGRVLRLLSTVTEAADQLEEDALEWKQHVARIPEQYRIIEAERVNSIHHMITQELVRKVDSLFQRVKSTF